MRKRGTPYNRKVPQPYLRNTIQMATHLTFRSSRIIYYGPHACTNCGVTICKMGLEFGGNAFTYPSGPIYPNTEWHPHVCDPKVVAKLPKPTPPPPAPPVPTNTATIEHHVTDQGNGGANCGNCGNYLGSDPFKIPSICPTCQYTLIEGSIHIPVGGSDF